MNRVTPFLAVCLLASGQAHSADAGNVRIAECKLKAKLFQAAAMPNETSKPAHVEKSAHDSLVATESKHQVRTEDLFTYAELETGTELASRYPVKKVGLKALPVQKSHKFFDLKPSSALSIPDRLYVDPDTGMINFELKKGKLKDNIITFVNETRGVRSENMIWAVAPYKVAANMWVSGRTTEDVMQQIVGPYKTPSQVKFGLYTNKMFAVFYENDKEFNQ